MSMHPLEEVRVKIANKGHEAYKVDRTLFDELEDNLKEAALLFKPVSLAGEQMKGELVVKPTYKLYDYHREEIASPSTGEEGVIYWGHQVGNPKFEPGSWIRTSLVLEESKDQIETRNSIYILVSNEEVDEAIAKLVGEGEDDGQDSTS